MGKYYYFVASWILFLTALKALSVSFTFFGNNPNAMDDSRDISQQSQNKINPEMLANTNLEKNTQGRQKNCDYNLYKFHSFNLLLSIFTLYGVILQYKIWGAASK